MTFWLRLDLRKEFNGIRGPEMVKGHLDVAEWIKRSPMAKKVNPEEKKAIIDGVHMDMSKLKM